MNVLRLAARSTRVARRLAFPAAVSTVAALGACDTRAGSSDPDLAMVGQPTVSYEVLDADHAPDPAVEAIISPYRAKYEAWAVEVVGHATGPFTRGDPEATLDNLVAESILEAARALSARPVHLAMANDGGIRTDIDSGPIQLSEVFEVMPFENTVTVIDLSGHQVDSLAQQIARTGGEPVAGIRFQISDTPATAFDVVVDGAPLDLDDTYRIALADYLASGGGSWPQVWTPLAREDFTFLIRDAILDYIRNRDQVAPTLDGRITVGTP